MDVVLYDGITNLSNKLYNKGLDKLENSDFTTGIELLRKSVSINRSNIPARNLLGLGLFEVGHVGEAVKHWVISNMLSSDKNPAAAYIEKIEKNPRNLEKLNEAIVMYNRAQEHLRQNSDDLAVIQLKKAVETNPRFIDAMNLLALCHLIQNDKNRAAPIVERVLSMDVHNPVAAGYASLLNLGRGKPGLLAPTKKQPQAAAKSSGGSTYKAISSMQEKKGAGFRITEILFFILGIICAAAVGYFLIMPVLQREHADDIARINQDILANEANHQAELQAREAEMEAMQLIVDEFNILTNQQAQQAELQSRILEIHNAYNYLNDGLYQQAFHIVENVNMDGFPQDIIDRAAYIRARVYPELARQYFNAGQNGFNDNDPPFALPRLERAFRFMDESDPDFNELLFMLGSLYYADGRLQLAEERLLTLRDRASNFRPQATSTMLNSIATQAD